MNILLLRGSFNRNISVPSKLMLDINYSVIMNDAIKSFDCIELESLVINSISELHTVYRDSLTL